VEAPRYDIDNVTDRINKAIAAGDLEPLRGKGKPIPNLNRDPDWWVRALLDRERHAEQLTEIESYRSTCVASATAAGHLDEAREMIANLNAVLERWNNKAPEEFFMEPVSEIWLITERAKAPGY
jgi:hypothetical protein